MKITLPITALAAILGLALASVPVSVQAQTPAAATTTAPSAPKKTKYSGVLSAVDTTANTVTITDKTQAPKTLTITPTTKIKKSGKITTLADFKVGDKVGGSFTTDASGTMTALTLNTGGKAASKTPAAATTAAPAPAAQ